MVHVAVALEGLNHPKLHRYELMNFEQVWQDLVHLTLDRLKADRVYLPSSRHLTNSPPTAMPNSELFLQLLVQFRGDLGPGN
jgi:hypothetical protein